MKAFQFNPTYGHICPVCGTNDVRDSTLIPVKGTEVDGNSTAVQIHLDCLIEDLVLFPGSDNSVIGKSAPFYTTEAVDLMQPETKS